MTRFDCDYDEGIPWERWEQIVSNALGGRKGQAALAEMESALIALPEKKLIEGHLAADGAVCAVGALVAHHRAEREGVDIATVIDAMAVGVSCQCGHSRELHAEGACGGKGWKEGLSCYCDEYEAETAGAWDTAQAGKAEGLTWSVAWHLAYLNDEEFGGLTEAERYEKMLAWVRRAQGKEVVAA